MKLVKQALNVKVTVFFISQIKTLAEEERERERETDRERVREREGRGGRGKL